MLKTPQITFTRFGLLFVLLVSVQFVWIKSGKCQDEELSLADILHENWQATADSVTNYHAQITIFRFVFGKEEKFDYKSLLERFRKVEKGELKFGQVRDELFQDFYPGHKTPPLGSIWNHSIQIYSNADRHRVFWENSDKSQRNHYMKCEIGFVLDEKRLGQIQLENSGNREMFRYDDLILLPLFKSPKGFSVKPAKDEKLQVTSNGGRYKMLVGIDAGYVENIETTNKAATYRRWNFGGKKDEELDAKIPSFYMEIQFDRERPVDLSLTKIEKLKFNGKIKPGKFEFPVKRGYRIIDARNGLEKARVFAPTKDVSDVAIAIKQYQAFLKRKREKLNQKKSNRGDQSGGKRAEQDSIAPAQSRDLSMRGKPLKDASTHLNLWVILLLAGACSLASIFPFKKE